MVRSGRTTGTANNLISAVLTSILSILLGLAVFALIILWRLPKQKVDAGEFLLTLLFICMITGVGTLLSILISAITKSKFYSFVVPLLIFYAENEFLVGLNGGIFYNFSIQSLMCPEDKIVGFGFSVIITGVLYEAIDRIERGWYGNDV